MRKFQIAVIGYNKENCTDEATKLALQVGREIARSGAILICGGLGGVMEAACKGAKENNGTTVGIIPQQEFSFANKFCDIVICTGMGFARDLLVATSADGIIAVGGGVGTLLELAVGYMIKKTMVVVAGSGGVSESYAGQFLDGRKLTPLILANDAYSAVQLVINGKQ
jgi:uncharacterized protein (TIGR00725 family)